MSIETILWIVYALSVAGAAALCVDTHRQYYYRRITAQDIALYLVRTFTPAINTLIALAWFWGLLGDWVIWERKP